MKAASVIIHGLIHAPNGGRLQDTAARTSTTGGFETPIVTSGAAESDQASHLALQFLIPAYIRIDILSCAFLRCQTYIADHEDVMKELRLDTSNGRKNDDRAILYAIAEILRLDLWKKQAAKDGPLNYIELVSKGTKIEQCLKRILADCQISRIGLSSTGEYPGLDICEETWWDAVDPSHEESLVNTVLANAALVYLYVVLSGAYPALPDINGCVRKNLSFLRWLINRDSTCSSLLPRLLWSLCISGCMAVESDQLSFKNLINAAGEKISISKFFPERIATAAAIMQRCWIMRTEQSSDEVDWIAATVGLADSCWFV